MKELLPSCASALNLVLYSRGSRQKQPRHAAARGTRKAREARRGRAPQLVSPNQPARETPRDPPPQLQLHEMTATTLQPGVLAEHPRLGQETLKSSHILLPAGGGFDDGPSPAVGHGSAHERRLQLPRRRLHAPGRLSHT